MIRLLAKGLLVSATLFITGAEAAGVLRLAHSAITLGGAEPAGELAAENVGDSPLYLDVIQELVQTPVTQPEVRIPVGEVANPSLLISHRALFLLQDKNAY